MVGTISLEHLNNLIEQATIDVYISIFRYW